MVREGHAQHHVRVALEHGQGLQLLPAEHADLVVPAGRGQDLTVPSDAQLRDPGVEQLYRLLLL